MSTLTRPATLAAGVLLLALCTAISSVPQEIFGLLQVSRSGEAVVFATPFLILMIGAALINSQIRGWNLLLNDKQLGIAFGTGLGSTLLLWLLNALQGFSSPPFILFIVIALGIPASFAMIWILFFFETRAPSHELQG